VQIMGLADADLHGPFAEGATRFPPTLFVHMPRDSVTAHAVARTVQLLRRAGTAALALEARALCETSPRVKSLSH